MLSPGLSLFFFSKGFLLKGSWSPKTKWHMHNKNEQSQEGTRGSRCNPSISQRCESFHGSHLALLVQEAVSVCIVCHAGWMLCEVLHWGGWSPSQYKGPVVAICFAGVPPPCIWRVSSFSFVLKHSHFYFKIKLNLQAAENFPDHIVCTLFIDRFPASVWGSIFLRWLW